MICLKELSKTLKKRLIKTPVFLFCFFRVKAVRKKRAFSRMKGDGTHRLQNLLAFAGKTSCASCFLSINIVPNKLNSTIKWPAKCVWIMFILNEAELNVFIPGLMSKWHVVEHSGGGGFVGRMQKNSNKSHVGHTMHTQPDQREAIPGSCSLNQPTDAVSLGLSQLLLGCFTATAGKVGSVNNFFYFLQYCATLHNVGCNTQPQGELKFSSYSLCKHSLLSKSSRFVFRLQHFDIHYIYKYIELFSLKSKQKTICFFFILLFTYFSPPFSFPPLPFFHFSCAVCAHQGFCSIFSSLSTKCIAPPHLQRYIYNPWQLFNKVEACFKVASVLKV